MNMLFYDFVILCMKRKPCLPWFQPANWVGCNQQTRTEEKPNFQCRDLCISPERKGK